LIGQTPFSFSSSSTVILRRKMWAYKSKCWKYNFTDVGNLWFPLYGRLSGRFEPNTCTYIFKQWTKVITPSHSY
jgi:hypothetical protein